MLQYDGVDCAAVSMIVDSVSFAYSMFGGTVGRLELDDGANGVKWSKFGEQGEEWQQAAVTIHSASFAFKGVRGRGWSGDIAIDAVQVLCSPGPPPPPPLPPARPPESPLPPAPPSPPVLPTVSYSFDVDDPAWSTGPTLRDGTPTGSLPFGFARYAGPGPDHPDTGPAAGHKGNPASFYFLAQTQSVLEDSLFTLEYLGSACTNPGQQVGTLEFYYHMAGANMGNLSLVANGEVRL